MTGLFWIEYDSFEIAKLLFLRTFEKFKNKQTNIWLVHEYERNIKYVIRSKGIIWKLNMRHFQSSIWLKSASGEVHFAENPTWIGVSDQ